MIKNYQGDAAAIREKMTEKIEVKIKVKNLDHLGIVAGIIDELVGVEIINKNVGIQSGEIVTAGQIVKAILLNGLGFVSRPLYLFPQFFEGKATEHLLGKGILPEHSRLETIYLRFNSQ